MTMNDTTPIFYAPVGQWCRMVGMGRTKAYAEIAAGNLRLIKMGPKKSLIDVQHGLAWMRSLPSTRKAA